MDDLIRRADAIEAVMAEGRKVYTSEYANAERIIYEADAVEVLSMLPSAEPKRVLQGYCKGADCRWWNPQISGCNRCVMIQDEYTHTSADAEWISCSERLPDIDTPVIICTASGGITDGYRWNEKDWFLAWSEYNGWHDGNDGGRITAWMPLPTPYKGGDTE